MVMLYNQDAVVVLPSDGHELKGRYDPRVILSGQQSSMPFFQRKEILRMPSSKRACHVIFI
jgi:hypothetical protein